MQLASITSRSERDGRSSSATWSTVVLTVVPALAPVWWSQLGEVSADA